MCSKGLGVNEEELLKELPTRFISGGKIIARKTNHDNLFVTILVGGIDIDTGEINRNYKNIKQEYCKAKDRKLCELIPLKELHAFAEAQYDINHSQYMELDMIRELGSIMEIATKFEFFNNSISEETYKDLYTHNMIQLDFMFYKINKINKIINKHKTWKL